MLVAAGERTRAVPAVAETLKGAPADRRVGARSAVLPGSERRPTNRGRGSTEARRRAPVKVGAPDVGSRGTQAIVEPVELRAPD